MTKGMKDMEKRLKACDLVIEVRDSRAPLSSINPAFHSLVNNKQKVVVFNKSDLGLTERELKQVVRSQVLSE